MAEEGPWWFTVKYGEDQQALFNMDCWSCTLIDHVCHARRHPTAQRHRPADSHRPPPTAQRRHPADSHPRRGSHAQIKDKCGYFKIPEKVDLQKEGGSMMDMPTLGRQPAKEVLEPKGTYILYKLVVAEEGAAPTPEMLWTPPEGYAAPAAGGGGGKAPPKKGK